ncbi:MAG: hypothetical protein U0798_13050 [Gemmataceae bacterium]
MNRIFASAFLVVLTQSFVLAAEPPADSIDRAILVQKAMADARDFLVANDPASASAVLEAQLAHANVNRSYLDLLCKAYHEEKEKLRLEKSPDLKRLETIAKRLAILEGTKSETALAPAASSATESATNLPSISPPSAVTPPPAALPTSVLEPAREETSRPAPTVQATQTGAEWLKTATSLFNQGKTDPSRYREAARYFAKAYENQTLFTPDQLTAWVYCRVRVAAEELNKPTANRETARAMEADVTAALALAPQNAGLQKAGRDVLASARSILGTKAPSAPAVASTPPAPRSPGSPIVQVGETSVVASANRVSGTSVFVNHTGQPELAATIAKAVETQRKAITEKWFGPAGSAWSPVCEITLHANGSAFTSATGLSERATGKAEVVLENGQVKSRRIDLRADDESLLTVSLPRELAHLVLADLFPNKPPPRWAEEAIAVLSTSPAEVERYKRAAPRLALDGALPSAEQLMASTGFPSAERITGFYVVSVSLVDFLVSKKGEKTFATFLTDSQRYGIEPAFKRQYGMTPSQLDAAWRRSEQIR